MTAPTVPLGTATGLLRSARASSHHSPARALGVALACVVAVIATLLSRVLPVVGAPVLAIVIGALVSATRRPTPTAQPGLRFASKTVLQGSIVVLGSGLSVRQVWVLGTSSLPVLVSTLVVALVAAATIGRKMGVGRDLGTLIGVGTAICGASAIGAVEGVIGAADADVSYAIATIFCFNVTAVATFPAVGHLLGMSPHSFGLWAGTAVNDMSSVAASATIFGHNAVATAVVVKLTRTLMIIPVVLGITFWRRRRRRQPGGDLMVLAAEGQTVKDLARVFPTFIGWVMVAVVLNTLGLVPAAWHPDLAQLAQVMITVALAAIGLSSRLVDIGRAGRRPLILGAVLWALVSVTSLGLQAATGSLH
jgi:uncharacterized integral membrane protein (TIGR00698 family)